VANGEHVHSPGCCKDLPITISNGSFTLDCFGLMLGPYEMVLGVQWLKSLGPILWDFTARTIVFVRNRHRVCWQATKPTGGFHDVFTMPAGLSPVYPCNHQIRLLPSMAQVVVRPYRYTHLQKELKS
jgi:hypothetical protein